MLLAFKDDKNTHSFYMLFILCTQCHYYIWLYMYRGAFIFNSYMYIGHDYVYMSMSAIVCCLCYVIGWAYFTYDLHLYGCYVITHIQSCHCSCPIILLHPPSYNVVNYNFCVTVWCLSDDVMSFFLVVTELLQCLCNVWYCYC